ncbi:FbpB family small basic protein [Niallia endozanthoxylica]|uniref:FbpB family small basic protein n=1 Tax=Niallia endozanthoxylica TaxID=2036016 RepID=A0A5J5I031_9BACI|nr:FbpB family small basic protein [Niallia endozanthoxylica]
MTKRKKLSFEKLVKEYKLQLLRDPAFIEKMEERLEKKHISEVQ